MAAHYLILTLKPDAKHPWEQMSATNPLTHEAPNLAKLIADQLGVESGSYLVAVSLSAAIAAEAPTAPEPHAV